MRRLWLAVPVLALAIMSQPNASAVGGPQVTSLTAGPSSVIVRDWGTAQVRIGARIVDPAGIGACALGSDLPGGDVTAELTRVGGGPPDRAYAYLNRVPGVRGTYAGTWRVASTRSGQWEVTGLWWCHLMSAAGQDGYSVNPRALGISPTIRVQGIDAPTMTLTRVPAVVDYGQAQTVVLTLRDAAGRPLAGRAVTLGRGDDCGTTGNGGDVVATDSRGRLVLDASEHAGDCVFLASPQLEEFGTFSSATLLARETVTKAQRYRSVSAVPSSWRLRSAVTIAGRVEPRFGTVLLQREVGSAWVTVGRGAVAADGTYALVLRAPASAPSGALRHRVVVMGPPGAGLVATASRDVWLRAVTA